MACINPVTPPFAVHIAQMARETNEKILCSHIDDRAFSLYKNTLLETERYNPISFIQTGLIKLHPDNSNLL